MTTYTLNAQTVSRQTPQFVFTAVSLNNGDNVKFVNDGRRTQLLILGENALDAAFSFSIPIIQKVDGMLPSPLIYEANYGADHKFQILVAPLDVLTYGTDIELSIDAAAAITIKMAVIKY